MQALRRCNLIPTSRLLTRLSSTTAKPPSPATQSSPSHSRAGTTHEATATAAASSTPTTTTTTHIPRRSDASASRGNDVMGLPSPAPPPSSQQPQTLRVGGDAVRLDAMGPLVVNVDGSVGRVANWAEMTPAEREGTMRLLQRRNQERLRVLKEKAVEVK